MKGLRQKELQDLLRRHGQMTVRQLAEQLEVSEATIRRDLQELSGAAGFERMHGGVSFSDDTEPPVIARRRQNADVKMALARRVAAEVDEGATIFIGSGSTMGCLAECLLDRHELTVITNAHNVATELAGAPGVNIVMTGGALRKGEMSLIGPIAERTLRQMPFEVAFISVQGVSAEAGLSNAFAPEASTDRVVVELAPRLVVVAESYKIGRVAPIGIGPADAVDLLVTDADPGDAELQRLASLGLTISQDLGREGA
jgi:DeoR/GlpR family transcriptional regulator of sugar metabolism